MLFDMLNGFDGREEELEKIKRYNMERFSPMFYRTDDLIHSKRVHFLLRDFLPLAVAKLDGDFNADKALVLALVHDDAEVITGDIQLYYKERMTAKEMAEVNSNEEKAIEQLANMWPKFIGPFSYRALLYHALRKDCLEAQIVSYCDKIDAYCESLHEVHAGNPRFAGPARNYVLRIKQLVEKFPALKKLVPGKHPLLEIPVEVDFGGVLANGRFHDIEGVKRETGISHYDRWKEITAENFGYGPLIEVKEC